MILLNKAVKTVIVSSIALFTLTGCMSNERGKIIKEGKEAYAQNDMQVAFDKLTAANRMDPFSGNKDESNLNSLYIDIGNDLFVSYINEGDTLKKNKEFEKAMEYYEAATTISATHEGLNEQIKETKKLIEQQEALDEYTVVVADAMHTSNILLKDYSKELDSLYVGVISNKEFINTMKGIIPQSNNIVAQVDVSATKVKEGLFDAHNELIDYLDYQHRTFVLSLDFFVDEDLEELSNRYTNIKKKKSDLVETLKKYADDNGVALKLDEMLIELDKPNTDPELLEEFNSTPDKLSEEAQASESIE